MAVDIVMPQMGESIFEGTITKWLKKPGDKTVVGVIDAAGDGAAKAAAPAQAPAPAPATKAAEPARAPAPPPAARPQIVPPAQPARPAASAPAAASGPGPAAAPSRPAGERVHSSPLVRRMAKEHGIDLASIPGSGAGGRISKQDIEAYLAGGAQPSAEAAEPAAAEYTPPARVPQRAAAPPPPPPATSGGQVYVAFESAVPREKMYFGNYEVQPMSIMRQRIAEHMIASKRVSAHVYSVDEVDMTKVASVILHKEINIGIAVALDWGLIVPVIKNADEKNILGIQRNLNDLAERARTKKLKPEEVQEGTFSITNPGVFGGLFGLPVISQPNVGILGLGAIEKRPVVINDSIAIRSMCYVTLSYDHRVVDGAIAHQFLHKVKETLENWSEPLL